jgi:hypothetical protein
MMCKRFVAFLASNIKLQLPLHFRLEAYVDVRSCFQAMVRHGWGLQAKAPQINSILLRMNV